MTNYFAHETAVLDKGATIGTGTKIWHFSHLMGECIVGSKCNIGQNVFIGNRVEVGDNVKIQNNVSIYEGVEIEDDVFLGPSMVFTNVINPRSLVDRKNAYQKTIVRKGASIGANATILCGITIGKFAFVGAGTVVTQSVDDFELVVGNPSRKIGWMSAYGNRLEFDDKGVATCSESGEKYIKENNLVRKLS